MTYDQETVYDLFSNTIEAAEVLGDDYDLLRLPVPRHVPLLPSDQMAVRVRQRFLEYLRTEDAPIRHPHVTTDLAGHANTRPQPLVTPKKRTRKSSKLSVVST